MGKEGSRAGEEKPEGEIQYRDTDHAQEISCSQDKEPRFAKVVEGPDGKGFDPGAPREAIPRAEA